MAEKDNIFYCDRCGISFLWTQEEQRQSCVKPQLCPGCRHALPAPGRERGMVKWFNVRKQYGFITRADSPDIFVHRAQLRGANRLQPDDLVEFSVGESDKGPMAVDIHIVQRARRAQSSSAITS